MGLKKMKKIVSVLTMFTVWKSRIMSKVVKRERKYQKVRVKESKKSDFIFSQLKFYFKFIHRYFVLLIKILYKQTRLFKLYFNQRLQFCSQQEMMKPIQFRNGQKINMNLLKLEIDRRIDVIKMMVKGMNSASNKATKKSHQITDTHCQTQETHLPLHQIPNLTLSNTPSMKSLKSPTNSKRSTLLKNKQNEVIQSFSIASKNKKLNPIQESQQEALRTSRCMLQSQKKKNTKKLNLNQESSKKSYRPSVLRKKTIQSSSIRDDVSDVMTSFQSARKATLTEKKNFQHFSSRNLKKFTTQEKVTVNFSVNSSIYDLSKSNSKLSIRKSSVNFNDSFVLNSTSNINKKQNQSLSTNNVSSAFVSDYLIGDSFSNGTKRMTISEDVKMNIQAQLQAKLQNLKKKAMKEPKANNIRISLLKRLQQKHQKTVQVTK